MKDVKNGVKNILKNIFVQFVSFILLILSLGVGYAAWTALTANQGATGQPVNQTLMQGIINNLNDLNARIQNMETNNTQVSDVISVNFGVQYCPNSDAFVYAHKQSAGAALQGVRIDSSLFGTIAKSTGQSEGHLGYESASSIIKKGECFTVYDEGGGQNKFAYYRNF